VLRDISYKDDEFMAILLIVNISEMVVDLVFVFHEDVYIACSLHCQGKLRWRSVALLTCKLVVELGYRGERLIEPSSSWLTVLSGKAND
jgi:hypothetical protein